MQTSTSMTELALRSFTTNFYTGYMLRRSKTCVLMQLRTHAGSGQWLYTFAGLYICILSTAYYSRAYICLRPLWLITTIIYASLLTSSFHLYLQRHTVTGTDRVPAAVELFGLTRQLRYLCFSTLQLQNLHCEFFFF